MPYLLKIYLSNKNRLTHPFSHAKKSLIKNIQEIIGNKIYSVAPIKSDMIIESNNKKSAEEKKSFEEALQHFVYFPIVHESSTEISFFYCSFCAIVTVSLIWFCNKIKSNKILKLILKLKNFKIRKMSDNKGKLTKRLKNQLWIFNFNSIDNV